MISFFRKIRQKLLAENRVTRYLVYALGEIALVMIGILLALQVNNWNEERKQKNEESRYLAALQTDFKAAQSWFRLILGAVQEQLDHNEHLLSILDGTPGSIPNDSIVSMIRKSFIDVPFGVQVPAFTDLINSGKLSVLQSEQLRRSLSEFETANSLANDYAQRASEQWAGQVTEFFIERFNVSSIYGRESDVNWDYPGIPSTTGYTNTPVIRRFSSDEEAVWGRELANRIVIKNVLLGDAARSARDVLQFIEQILTLIDDSLEKSPN